MTSTSKSKRIPELLLLLAVSSLAPSSTQAAGGFFGRAPPDQPVTSTRDAVVFGVQGNTVTMQVQLEYKETSGDQSSSDFAWILPIPVAPTSVEMGSALLMDALYENTRPQFKLEIFNATILQEPAATTIESKQFPFGASASSTCKPEALAPGDCPTNQGPSRGQAGGFNPFGVAPAAPIIVERGTAGIFDYTVLQGDGASVVEWLSNNSYTFPEDTMDLEAALDSYVMSGHSFVAVQMQPDAPQGAMQPLKVQYELPTSATDGRPNLYSVPLFLSNAQDLSLNVYFLSDVARGRAVPVNYLDLTLDDAYVDWVGCYEDNDEETGDDQCYQDDYDKRFQEVVTDMENHTLVTEYAGPSSTMMGTIMTDRDWKMLEGLKDSADWLEFLTLLEQSGVPDNGRVQDILKEHIPLSFLFEPPFQCAQWGQLYHPAFAGQAAVPSMEDCFEIFNPPNNFTWNASVLAEDLFENVLEPAREAQAWLDSFEWLTRFLGYVPDTAAITKDPYFAIAPTSQTNLLVGRHHRATAIPKCAVGSELDPTLLEITLLPREKKNAESDVVTFWQAAMLDCPSWKKTAPGIIWDLDEAIPRVINYAESFIAHGITTNHTSVFVGKNQSSAATAIFDPEALEAAIAFGEALFQNLTAPAVAADDTVVDVALEENSDLRKLENELFRSKSGAFKLAGLRLLAAGWMAASLVGLL